MIRTTLLGSLLAALSFSAAAQEPEVGAAGDAGGGGAWHVAFDPRSYAKADFDKTGGDVSLSRYGLRGEGLLPLSDTILVTVNAKYEASAYGGTGTFDTQEISFAGTLATSIASRHSLFASAGVGLGAGENADLADGFYGKAGGGFAFEVKEDLLVGFGLFVVSRMEEDMAVIPFPLVDWQINDRSRISFAQATDPSLSYTYRLSNTLTPYVTFSSDVTQFRLDNGTGPGVALVDQELGLRGGAVWQTPVRGLRADASAGLAKRKLIIDTDGTETFNEDVKPAAVVGASVSYAF